MGDKMINAYLYEEVWKLRSGMTPNDAKRAVGVVVLRDLVRAGWVVVEGDEVWLQGYAADMEARVLASAAKSAWAAWARVAVRRVPERKRDALARLVEKVGAKLQLYTELADALAHEKEVRDEAPRS